MGLQLIRGHHQVPKEEIQNASLGDESRYIWPKSMTIYHQGKVGRIYLGAQFCIWDHVWSRIGGRCSSIYNNKRINIVVRATMAYLHNIGDKGLLGCLPSSLTRNMGKYDAYEVVVAINPSMLDISPNSHRTIVMHGTLIL